MVYIEAQALYKDPFKPVTVIVTAVAQRDLYREQEKSLRLCGPFSASTEEGLWTYLYFSSQDLRGHWKLLH